MFEKEPMLSLSPRSRPQRLLPASALMLSLSLGSIRLLAQSVSSTQEGTGVPISVTQTSMPPASSYVDYLKAFELAETGSKSAAFRLLAEGLRSQPDNLEASRLAFRLLTEQRTSSGLRLQGHTGVMTSASYSPDGTKILTTSTDKTARVWDARTGLQLIPSLEHEDEVVTGVFSRDGKKIATGTDDGKIAIWDVNTGKKLVSSMELQGSAWSVSFSPDGKIVAAASEGGKARTWDVATGKPLSPLIEYHESAYRISFSHDGKFILIANGDNYADLRDSRTGVRISRLRQHNTIYSAQFSPDDKRIVTAGEDATAEIWDTQSGTPTGVVMNHGFGLATAEFSGDASLVVTASKDHTARIWNANSGKLMVAPLQHPAPVGRASFSLDNRLVATVAGDKAMRLWDTFSGDQVMLPIVIPAGSPDFSFSPDGLSILIAGGSSGWVLDLPPNDKAPSWLADILDFASTLNNFDQARKPDLVKMEALRTQLSTSKASDPWTLFGKWYFADITQRPISPWSHVTLESYVNLLIAKGDRLSLEYAKVLSRPFPSWLAKVNASLLKLPPEQPSQSGRVTN